MPTRKGISGGPHRSVFGERMALATALIYEGKTVTTRSLMKEFGMSRSAAKRMMTALEWTLGPRVEVALIDVKSHYGEKREIRRKT